jgi:hypothetical protein
VKSTQAGRHCVSETASIIATDMVGKSAGAVSPKTPSSLAGGAWGDATVLLTEGSRAQLDGLTQGL